MSTEQAATDAQFTDEQYEAEFNAQVAKREEAKAPAVVPEPKTEAEPAAIEKVVEAVAVEPKAVEKAAEPKPVVAVPKEPTVEELLAQVPEAARPALKARLDSASAKVAKLEQDNRSMTGRVSAYQRRYEEASGKRPVEAPKPVTTEQKKNWDSFQEEYPELAAAIEARFAAEPKGENTQELLQYVEDQKRRTFLEDAWEAVDAVHPNWRKTGATKEFQTWKASSPAYEKLASSDDIADAVALFDLYEAHRVRNPAPAAVVQDTAAADQVAARRQRQTEGALSPTGKRASPNDAVDFNDEDQLFATYAKHANARLTKRLH